MALSRRYRPSWPPGESAYIGMDLSPLLPPGVVLTAAELEIVLNTNPVQAQTDFSQEACICKGRQVWCFISGGAEGTDYQLRFSAADSANNLWHRTGLLLCAESA